MWKNFETTNIAHRSMLKICHITSKHTPFDTRIFLKECTALKAQYNVVLIAANAKNETINDIEIIGFKYRKGQSVRNHYRIFRKAIKQKAAVYHIHDAELLPLAMLLKRLGNKIIYDVHENYRETLKEHNYSLITQTIFSYFDHWVARHGALILAERSYIPIYQQRAKSLCVVENFCEINALQPFENTHRTECRNLVYIGTIHSHRGALVMLEVLNLLRLRGMDIRLDLIGSISEKNLMEKLENLPYYSKIKDDVTWYGPLNLSDSYRIAQQSFAGLCLLDGVANHTESYPTKLFEYLAVGLPVIASNWSLYRSVVERHNVGICVAYNDSNAIADAIETIFTNKELQKQFSLNGPKIVAKNYNWNTEERILLDFYKTIIGV